MIAYPTPTFDAKTIRTAPGYRPTGKSGMTMKTDQPEAVTAQSVPNKKTKKNGGYFNLGARFDDIPKKFKYNEGTPLSRPNADGNQLDTMLVLQPQWAEPKNPMMTDILDILNAKLITEERKGRLTAAQVKALDERGAKRRQVDDTSAVRDFVDAQARMNKDKLVLNAMENGFSRKEAEKAYEKMREDEAVRALKKERQPSEMLRDVLRDALDSKFGTGVVAAPGSAPGAGIRSPAPDPTKALIRTIASSPGKSSASAFRPIGAALAAAAPAPAGPPAPVDPSPRSKSVGGRPRSSLGNPTLNTAEIVQRLRGAGVSVSPTLYAGVGRGRKGNTGVRMSQHELTFGTMDDTLRRAQDLFKKHMAPDS
jgi:hypothetical protein